MTSVCHQTQSVNTVIKLLDGVSDVVYNKVEICGVDTSKLTVLKEAEKMTLLKKMHAGIERRGKN